MFFINVDLAGDPDELHSAAQGAGVHLAVAWQGSESPRSTGSIRKMVLPTTPKITLALNWWFEEASYSVSPWI